MFSSGESLCTIPVQPIGWASPIARDAHDSRIFRVSQRQRALSEEGGSAAREFPTTFRRQGILTNADSHVQYCGMPDIPAKLRERYTRLKAHSAAEESASFALEILADDRVGLIADITSKLSTAGGNIAFIQSWNDHDGSIHTFVQIDNDSILKDVLNGICGIPSVRDVDIRPSHRRTWGKRIIVIGGGAQVAQVAAGAIAEADRHNIRGETISVDTIPIVGESELAEAVRGTGRLHRVGMVVLAGALMGGEITRAATELRQEYGIPVMALRMAGSICDAVDLTVTDPLQAGVMAVMLISHIGQFDLLKVHGRRY